MRNLILIPVTMMVFLFLGGLATAQGKFMTKTANMTVEGTSTLHDWHMKSSSAEVSAMIEKDAAGKVTAVKSMSFTMAAKSLKSGKDAMDKNAYKSLKTDQNPNITATLKKADVTAKDDKTFLVKAVVALTVAGKTLDTPLEATIVKVSETSYTIKGSKSFKMSAFEVKPPSFMMGAVKTGDDVTLKFDLTLNQ